MFWCFCGVFGGVGAKINFGDGQKRGWGWGTIKEPGAYRSNYAPGSRNSDVWQFIGLPWHGREPTFCRLGRRHIGYVLGRYRMFGIVVCAFLCMPYL